MSKKSEREECDGKYMRWKDRRENREVRIGKREEKGGRRDTRRDTRREKRHEKRHKK